jgi:hypothetical protein
VLIGNPCACCECLYRLHIKAIGFEGGARWTISGGLDTGQINLFFGSASHELGQARPAASADPIVLGDLELVSDDGFVSLQWTQSEGHVLRLSFTGANALLDSDDSVTLSTVDENTLEDLPDWMGNDFLSTVGSWEVKITKPSPPCVCNCYCGQVDLSFPDAPSHYSLQFAEDFFSEDGAFYAPTTPADGFYPDTSEEECPIVAERWSEPFILRRVEGVEPILYASEPIPFGRCNTRTFILSPCDSGTALLAVGGTSARAPIAPLPGWKLQDYIEGPSTYTDELFAGAIDFGFAVVTPSEEAPPAEECLTLPNGEGISAFPGCFGACPPTEITVRIHAEYDDPPYNGVYPDKFVDATYLTASSYSLSLVPEESAACFLKYRYESEETAVDSELGQTHPHLRIEVDLNAVSPAGCDCGATAQLRIGGVTKPMIDWHPDYANDPPFWYSPPCKKGQDRYTWFMGHTFTFGGQPAVASAGLTSFGSDDAGDDPACVTPCEENFSFDEPETPLTYNGVVYQMKTLVTLVGSSPSHPLFLFPPRLCIYDATNGTIPFNIARYRLFSGYSIEAG